MTSLSREDVLRVLAANGAGGAANEAGGASARGAEDVGGHLGMSTGVDGLETAERWLGFLERVEPLFAKFSARIMQVREWEQRNAGGPEAVEAEDYGSGEIRSGPERVPTGPGPAQPATGSDSGPGAPAPLDTSFMAIKLYQWVCGALANQPMDMTIETVISNMLIHMSLPEGATVDTTLATLRKSSIIARAAIDQKLQEIMRG